MLSYKESLKILKETDALLEGHFILSSGLHSEKYIQCAQLLSKPKKAKFICESLAEKIRKGFKINKGQKILILEDVITTGKSSLQCSNLATKMGAEIVGYACLIDRSAGTTNIDKKIVSQIEILIPTYSKENLPKHLKGIKAIKPGSRNL
jgi:orotate phosphoribosyltransferase